VEVIIDIPDGLCDASFYEDISIDRANEFLGILSEPGKLTEHVSQYNTTRYTLSLLV